MRAFNHMAALIANLHTVVAASVKKKKRLFSEGKTFFDPVKQFI